MHEFLKDVVDESFPIDKFYFEHYSNAVYLSRKCKSTIRDTGWRGKHSTQLLNISKIMLWDPGVLYITNMQVEVRCEELTIKRHALSIVHSKNLNAKVDKHVFSLRVAQWKH